MKKEYAYFVRKEINSEIYLVDKTYYNVVWGTNTFHADVYVYKWTGEYCKFDELPDAIYSEWVPVDSFDFKYNENGEIDWLEYSRQLNKIFLNDRDYQGYEMEV